MHMNSNNWSWVMNCECNTWRSNGMSCTGLSEIDPFWKPILILYRGDGAAFKQADHSPLALEAARPSAARRVAPSRRMMNLPPVIEQSTQRSFRISVRVPDVDS